MIKQGALFAVGMFFGLVVVALFVVYNPFVSEQRLSPLAVTENEVVFLSYPVAAKDAIIYTNSGEARSTPNPPKVLQLWEPTVRNTTASLNLFEDSRGRVAGIGVKFSSDSELSSVPQGKALVNAVWHIYMPGRGSMFIEQTENYWRYIQDIVIPAYRSSADTWRGNWLRSITTGPGPLGTAWVAGGSGVFAGMNSSSIETLAAKAYTVDDGPVAMDGELTIEIPRQEMAITTDTR